MKKLSTFYLFLTVNSIAYAEISTDGSLGAVQHLSGQMTIPQSLGTTVGNNLFHSFQTFNINSGESATFTGNNALQNVISRVTGGQISTIDGLLKSEIGNANFYFINPAGVTFGVNAQLDVPAAFHVSTADHLKFADGAQFSASNPNASTLSIAEPASFGFLGNSSGAITVNGSQLTLKTGQTLDLVARNITLNSADKEISYDVCDEFGCSLSSFMVQFFASLNAPSGEIRLVALNGEGTVNLQQNGFGQLVLPNTTPSAMNAGNININNSIVSTDGNDSGYVALWGNEINIDNQSLVTANNNESVKTSSTQSIEIQANNLLINHFGHIFSKAQNSGNAGTITINTDLIDIQNAGAISACTTATGNAGKVNIMTDTLNIDGDSSTGIFVETEAGSSGHAGTIAIDSNTLNILGSGRISAGSYSSKDAGVINITANNALTIDNRNGVRPGIWAESNLWNTGGAAGNISIINHGTVDIKGGLIAASGLGSGHSGNIDITAGEININSNDYAISAEAVNSLKTNGSSGKITLNADRLHISGTGPTITTSTYYGDADAGNIQIFATDIILDNAKNGILSKTVGAGNAGTITITAMNNGNGNLNVINGSKISTTTDATGNAGNIIINADNLKISDSFSEISSNTSDSGNAGNIAITTQSLDILKSSRISSDISGSGSGGNITINVSDSLNILDAGVISNSTNTNPADNQKNGNHSVSGHAGNISVNAKAIKIAAVDEIYSYYKTTGILSEGLYGGYGSGDSGTITLNSDSLDVLTNSSISSRNVDGKGGDISITTHRLKIDGQTFSDFQPPTRAGIYSSAQAKEAGKITLKTDTLDMLNFGQISSSATSQNQAGNIGITAKIITLDRYVNIAANALSGGTGGKITINTESLNIFEGGQISSSTGSLSLWTGLGTAGDIFINAKNIQIKDTDLPDIEVSFIEENNVAYQIKPAGIFSQLLSSNGVAGTITVISDSLDILNGGQISTTTEAIGNAGHINVTANSLTIDRKNSGVSTGIFSSSYNSNPYKSIQTGDAGTINVHVANALTIDAKDRSGLVPFVDGYLDTKTGISSSATASSIGKAGIVTVNAKTVDIINQGEISSDTSSKSTGEVGKAGNLEISATEKINLAHLGSISSSTFGAGNAGNVFVSAPVIAMNNANIKATAEVNSSGKAGSINVSAARSLTITDGAAINSSTFGSGNAGQVTIDTSLLTLDSGGKIASGTRAEGNAGQINVNADIINITGRDDNEITGVNTSTFGSGNAGEITLNAKQLNISHGGKIVSATDNSGNAGEIIVTADAITISGENGALITGIITDAREHSYGKAGSVTINTKQLTLNKNAQISSDTYSLAAGVLGKAGDLFITAHEKIALDQHSSISTSTLKTGNAGNLFVSAPTIVINNSTISASAMQESNGQTGDVTVIASEHLFLSNQANISIQNDATVANPAEIAAGLITVSAPEISLKNSLITAQSNGNIDAGRIAINFAHQLYMDPSFITTAANLGNGGNITVSGNGLINLQNSGFLTSVLGANGNGGNINVTANTLIMNNGVIQANAIAGNGGNINLNLQTLIPTQNLLIKGGSQVFWQPFISGFNVIQAASANGVNGAINVSSPQFNISGSISGLDSAALVLPIINYTLCEGSTTPASTLVAASKGSIPDDGLEFSFIPQLKLQSLSEITQNIFIPIHLSNLTTLKNPCAMLSL